MSSSLVARSPALLGLLLSVGAYAKDPCVTMKEQKLAQGVEVWAELSTCTEVTLTFTAELENMRATPAVPLTIDSAGRTRFLVTKLERASSSGAWNYTWHQDWKGGRRLGVIPPDFRYALPFRGTHPYVQGPHGRFSHGEGSQDEEAYDWKMPEGTLVYPAREGVVTAVRQDVTEGGPDVRFKHEVNYVTVRHDDGTFAEYLHLQPDGALVKVGDRVTPKQAIARSGNTGYTGGPHLHFAVFNTIDGLHRTTHPVTFTQPLGRPRIPPEPGFEEPGLADEPPVAAQPATTSPRQPGRQSPGSRGAAKGTASRDDAVKQATDDLLKVWNALEE